MAPPIDASRFEQLKASGDLPSPKGVSLAIMRLTLQDEVSIHDLAQIIRTDPAFTGRLIKAANGIIGYGRRPIVAVQDALTILGMPAVRNMALGFSLLTHYRQGNCEGFDYSRYWSSSLLRAVGMQSVTLRTRVTAPDEAYCLGLLSRVGELALATLYPHEYGVICKEVGGEVIPLVEQEMRAFAMNSAELGAAMLSDWGLPRLFTDAAYCVASGHENLHVDGSREAIITQTLYLAHQLGDLCLAEDARRPACLRSVQLAGSRLSFDGDSLATLTDGVAAEWAAWGTLLNLHVGTVPPFQDMSRQSEAETAGENTPESDAGGDVSVRSAPAEPAEAEAARLLRVLVVEQDATQCNSIRQVLVTGGFQVAAVGDGYTAIETALDFIPDIMLVARSLPDIAGVELVRTLRKTRIGRSIYAVVMSEDVTEESVIDAFDAGADDIVPRPVNARLLLAKMRAGKRLTVLHQEIERDREEIRHVAAELAVSNRRLQEAALIDPLTDCPNRRCFSDRLAQEWASASRNMRSLACMALDVDNFKQINDTYGHDVGDMALRQVAVAIRGVLRAHDLVARMGGDEFVVLCPDTTMEAAVLCAERVRSAIESAPLVADVPHLRASISIGVACRDPGTTDPDSLLKRADQSLYLAKQSGRNRVVAVPGLPCEAPH